MPSAKRASSWIAILRALSAEIAGQRPSVRRLALAWPLTRASTIQLETLGRDSQSKSRQGIIAYEVLPLGWRSRSFRNMSGQVGVLGSAWHVDIMYTGLLATLYDTVRY